MASASGREKCASTAPRPGHETMRVTMPLDDERPERAAHVATMRQGERTDLPPNGGTLQAETSTISQSDAAKLMQVPLRRVQRAARVKKSAPEMHAAIKAGTMKVSDATKKIAPSRRRRAR